MGWETVGADVGAADVGTLVGMELGSAVGAKVPHVGYEQSPISWPGHATITQSPVQAFPLLWVRAIQLFQLTRPPQHCPAPLASSVQSTLHEQSSVSVSLWYCLKSQV